MDALGLPKWKDQRDWIPTTAQKGLAHPPEPTRLSDCPAEVLYGKRRCPVIHCDSLHIVRGYALPKPVLLKVLYFALCG